jgi:hypothetical protein
MEVLAMKLRYFVLDAQGQLRKARKQAVKNLWEGSVQADTLGCGVPNELRLVSVVCDDDLLPKKLYLLRVPLIDGAFTEESRMTLYLFSQPDCVTPAECAEHHMAGWPSDFFRQMAVALDVPLAAMHVPMGIGGPLFVAAALGFRGHHT